MIEKFSFKNSYGEELKGSKWLLEKAFANVILITGLCEYSQRYERFATFLNSKMMNVYCLDHHGQGENVKDEKELGTAPKDYFYKMTDTIFELELELEKNNKLPVYLVGHSMGSFILQELIQRHPNCSKKIVLIGTSGPMFISKPGYLVLKMLTTKKNFDKPSKFAHKLSIGPYEKSVKGSKYPCEWISYNEENSTKYHHDKKCNYIRSWGAQLGLVDGVAHLHQKKKMVNVAKDVKILIVSGQDDPVSSNCKTITSLVKLYNKVGVKNVGVIIYDHMRHEILNEDKHNKVENDIYNFLIQ
ncbi:MAG: alpha/beta hydrolase [Bacilli bacterium]